MSWFNRRKSIKVKRKHIPHYRQSKMAEKYFEEVKLQVQSNIRENKEKESK